MRITGHRTRTEFERYTITDQTDTQEAEEFLALEHEKLAQTTSPKEERPNE